MYVNHGKLFVNGDRNCNEYLAGFRALTLATSIDLRVCPGSVVFFGREVFGEASNCNCGIVLCNCGESILFVTYFGGTELGLNRLLATARRQGAYVISRPGRVATVLAGMGLVVVARGRVPPDVFFVLLCRGGLVLSDT